MDRYVYLRDVELRRDDSPQVCACGRGGIGPHWYRPDAGYQASTLAAAIRGARDGDTTEEKR